MSVGLHYQCSVCVCVCVCMCVCVCVCSEGSAAAEKSVLSKVSFFTSEMIVLSLPVDFVHVIVSRIYARRRFLWAIPVSLCCCVSCFV